jgi:glycosyltransferase involved in cell wall biosynthesis
VIQELIKKYSLQNFVETVGQISDVSSFYSRIDVLVLPSFYECMPLVAIEAMSARRAVIITKNTGLPELFGNKKECLFIDPYSETELREAMEMLMDDKYRNSLAIRSYEKVKEYNFNVAFEDAVRLLFE